MNAKAAKMLRKVTLLVGTLDKEVNYTMTSRGIRVSPTCQRGHYRLLKKMVSANEK